MSNLYVQRDAQGQVIGLSASPGGDISEAASPDDPEVQRFLREIDLDLVRVLEDVIDLLVGQGVFRFTDLPDSAQRKLLFRKNMRSHLRAVANPLSGEDDVL
jgi:hypothetical protein